MAGKWRVSIGVLAVAGVMVAGASPAVAQLRNPCPWVNDGDCDEPNGLNLCAPGTDTADRSNPNSNFGTGSGYAGGGGVAVGQNYSHPVAGCPNLESQGIPGTFTGAQLRSAQRLNATASGVTPLANCALPVAGAVGYVVGRPSNTLQISGMGGQPLDLSMESTCDATMLVLAADGTWHFNDDRSGMQPGLTLQGRQAEGRIQVWLGSYTLQG